MAKPKRARKKPTTTPTDTKREKRSIRGPDGPIDVELEKLRPRKAFLTLVRLVRAIGAPAASGLSQPEELNKLLASDNMEQAGMILLLNALPGLGESEDSPGIDAEEILDIADELIVGQAIIGGIAVESANVIDTLIPDVYTLLRVLRFALEFNFRPTSAGSGTDDGSSAPAPPAQLDGESENTATP